jgi:hypothetical protein
MESQQVDGVEVDCRGHPISGEGADGNADYGNLILVGVWLAVKENGHALYNLLSWLQLPEEGKVGYLLEGDVKSLADKILQMLFSFKHRGAIEKAAESLSLLCNKLLQSNHARH